MKFIYILLIASFISGCSMFTKFLPAKPKFPEPIKELTEPCPDLTKIEGNNAAITELLKIVVENYSMYYECSLKNEGWNDWYKKQKEIYDKIK